MKYTPILFKGEMVRAILAGTKTQTRRIVKPQPTGDKAQHSVYSHRCWLDDSGRSMDCPHGAPGDRLWVRETCCATTDASGVDGVQYAADCLFRPIKNSAHASNQWLNLYTIYGKRGATCPSILMPRWVSRITLELTAVRVERLNDISVDDALAEGVQCTSDGPWCAVAEYRSLWESINGAGSWAANPWVWVETFRRIDA